MRKLKIYALLFLLFLGFNALAQSSKSKSSKTKSSKSKTVVTPVDTATPPPPLPPPPPPPPTMMKYFVNSYPEFTVLVKAINATQLNSVFEGKDPVTVFAPVNKTFENLKSGTISNILKPQMKDSLKSMLTYIVVAGNWSTDDLTQKIKEGGGSYSLPSVGGSGKLNFFLDGTAVWVKDRRGTMVQLGIPVVNKNGTVYTIDKMLLP